MIAIKRFRRTAEEKPCVLMEQDVDRIKSLIGQPDLLGCCPWLGYVGQEGYGWVRIGGRKGPLMTAHRVVYAIYHSPPDPAMTIDHLCRTRHCVNPEHLEQVSNRENILRGESPAAHHARATHCKYGHEFDEANTRVTKNGRRECRACGRRRALENYYQAKADDPS